MNDSAIKQELGVQPSLTFEPRNMGVNQGFASQGDGMRNSALLLTNLLVYAGVENVFHEELSSEHVTWVIEHSGRVVGTVRAAGGGGRTAGNVTFLAVDEAG